jgi:outer membrane lipoprotein-sorting protein
MIRGLRQFGKGVITCIALLLCGAGIAQEAPSSEFVKVMQLLAQVKKSDAHFVERKDIASLTKPLMLSGRLSYVRGGRVERYVQAPYEERLVVDGDTLVVENISRGEILTVALRSHPGAWAFVEGLRATLGGDLATLERYYRPKFSGNVDAWTLELVPRDEQMARQVQSIRFRGRRAAITAIQVDEAGGDRSLMTITPEVP